MLLVPAGEFPMGSPERTGPGDERPRRAVYLDAFYLDRYPVTVALYRRFCEATGREMPPPPPWGWHDEHPVVNVSWSEAAAYAEFHGKRLPTEAEWEKACRGGTATLFSFGDDEAAADRFAWTARNSGGRTRPVGKARPNPRGFHDMHGNTWEWCADWYGSDYYRRGPSRNPPGPDSGEARVVRGGSWRNIPWLCRSASRFRAHPGTGYPDVGFRCAVSAPGPPSEKGPEAIVPEDEPGDETEGLGVKTEEIRVREFTPRTEPETIVVPGGPAPRATGPDGSEMVLVPAGTFLMGSGPGEGHEEERPRREIYLDGYYIGKYPVTVARYRLFCEATGREMPPEPRWGWQDDHPVINLTWHDAAAYAEHHGMRLPTEAEWEKACRAGTGTLYHFGDDPALLPRYAWFGEETGTTRPVGLKLPNPLGIHDLAGNAWEWCADWFSADYYLLSPADNPPGPETGDWKVLRGGSFSSKADFCRAAFRAWADPDSGGNNAFGFRCVMSANATE